jgi:DMSO/TMAO reductase YedYZ molybdopterin-dependent catalytic subunit
MPTPEVLGRNGTYVVFRKLHTRVAAYRQYLRARTASPEEQALLGAKMVGRWQGGTPLVLSPERDDPELGADPHRNNDFLYADDLRGFKCPAGAHARRANPRDALDHEGSVNVPATERAVTLECAGNGCLEMRPLPIGEPWGDYAVLAARWTGALLHEVLEQAHPAADGVDVRFEGADHGAYHLQPILAEASKDDLTFVRALPLTHAADPAAEILIAYEMNGEPLSSDHGAPFRIIVPHWYAVASVKWLKRIEVLTEPYTGEFQTGHYMYEWRRHDDRGNSTSRAATPARPRRHGCHSRRRSRHGAVLVGEPVTSDRAADGIPTTDTRASAKWRLDRQSGGTTRGGLAGPESSPSAVTSWPRSGSAVHC